VAISGGFQSPFSITSRAVTPGTRALAKRAELQVRSMRALAKLMEECQITPELLPRPRVYRAFRIVTAHPPPTLAQALMDCESWCGQTSQNPSSVLTFPRFVTTLLVLARMLYPEPGVGDQEKVSRLLSRMATSKGLRFQGPSAPPSLQPSPRDQAIAWGYGSSVLVPGVLPLETGEQWAQHIFPKYSSPLPTASGGTGDVRAMSRKEFRKLLTELGIAGGKGAIVPLTDLDLVFTQARQAHLSHCSLTGSGAPKASPDHLTIEGFRVALMELTSRVAPLLGYTLPEGDVEPLEVEKGMLDLVLKQLLQPFQKVKAREEEYRGTGADPRVLLAEPGVLELFLGTESGVSELYRSFNHNKITWPFFKLMLSKLGFTTELGMMSVSKVYYGALNHSSKKYMDSEAFHYSLVLLAQCQQRGGSIADRLRAVLWQVAGSVRGRSIRLPHRWAELLKGYLPEPTGPGKAMGMSAGGGLKWSDVESSWSTAQSE
jgi:hypothetical protein